MDERVQAECDGDAADRMRLLDAELAGVAEIVEIERIEGRAGGLRSDHDNYIA